ncbi:MAG: phage integrase SAM-like domain-containing protein, partial [Atopobiaceae bacterium]|nr:phage integrase SAM-like domain-containing protein [Atopobiaceae bacterium]
MAREYTKGFVRKHYGVWQAVVCWQEDGKQFRISKSTNIECVPNSNRGKGAAEDFLRRWRDELVLEASQENAFSSSTPFIEYVSQFIKVREGNGKVEDTTLRTYYTHKKRLMGTALGDMPIKDITYRDIEDFEQDLLEEGLSSSTRSHIHVFLK